MRDIGRERDVEVGIRGVVVDNVQQVEALGEALVIVEGLVGSSLDAFGRMVVVEGGGIVVGGDCGCHCHCCWACSRGTGRHSEVGDGE